MVNQPRYLHESWQRLENIDPTDLVLASGKPVLQKEETNKNTLPHLLLVTEKAYSYATK